MELDAGHGLTEVEFLKAYIHDLNCIVALPAAWSGGTASQILGTSLDVLRDVLHLDFIYARLKNPTGQAPIEMARVAQSNHLSTDGHDIALLLRGCLGDDPPQWPARKRTRVGDHDLSIATLQLGLQGEVGVVAAGSRRLDFPAATERLLLNVAANQAMVGLQDAGRFSAQKQIAAELDQRVGQRTAELAAANDELRREIAERRVVEEKLRKEEGRAKRSEELLAEAQHLSSTGSFLWEVASDVVTYSEETYRIYAFDPCRPVTLEMIAKRLHPEDLPLMYEMVDLARGPGADLDYEYRLQMPDQSVKHLHLVARATREQGGGLVYVGAIQDITERKSAEQALNKARSELARVARVTALGALTASIAHEVNQPLSGIITNAGTCLRMLASEPPNIDGARETARRTIRDGNRASEVIARLRAMFTSRHTKREAVDLNEAAREVVALSEHELQRSRVVLRLELAEPLPLIDGDRVQLQQVILNLLLNASDAMSAVEDRPRKLVITTDHEGDDRIRLSVQDSGMGFNPQDAERLFEAFYTTKNGGMGIGLAVSRSIVERHHGRLWASPNDGPGATFSFSIPRKSGARSGKATAFLPDSDGVLRHA
jgi:signal transduction histidine kinase